MNITMSNAVSFHSEPPVSFLLVSLFFVVLSAVNCSVLNVGRLVKTSSDSCLTSQMKFKTTCSFSCPQGYQLQGPSYKQCGANGQWKDSTKSVSCKGELKITGLIERTRLVPFFSFFKYNFRVRITANNAASAF